MTENGVIILAAGGSGLIRNGLWLEAGLTYDEWAGIGCSLDALGRSLQFAIGDWINYGEASFGEQYAQAIEFTVYDYHSLINLAAVARRVPMSLRKDNLTYSHHAAVVYLDDSDMQAVLLDEAVKQGWSVRQLRARVQEEQEHNNETEIDSTVAGHVCPYCGQRYTTRSE